METSKKRSKKKLSDRELDEKRKKCRERVRKHREKMSEEKKAEKRAKDREYIQKMKEAGVIKSINKLSSRQQRMKRKQWRKDSCNYRRKQNMKEEIVKESTTLGRKGSPRVQAGKKVAKRTYMKMRREIQSMKTKINKKDKKIETLRKKVYRLQNKQSNFSPRKQVKKIIGRKRVSPAIQKNLLLSYALMSGLSDKKKEICQNEKEKRMFNHIISLKIIKKYRMIGRLKNIVSYQEFRKGLKMKSIYFKRSYREQKSRLELQQSVQKFLEEDINSCIAPGAKDCITRNKVKHQKRYLRNTMQNLHKKFLEKGYTRISYPTFCRLKPFWILKPRVTNRDTCLCTKHANFEFLSAKLNYLQLIKEKQAEELCPKVCCDEKNKDCMERNCSRCKNKTLPVTLIGTSLKEDDETFYYQWVKKKEKIKNKNGEDKEITVTIKDKIACTVGELINKANTQIGIFLKHVFIMRHQFNAVKKIKGSLNANEVVVLMDFSQNYSCKFGSEIQTMHFGASKPQVTLHTGVLYHNNVRYCHYDPSKLEQCISFCSVSSSLRHDPSAIWAHLQPVIKIIKEDLPSVDTIHFQSDGPTPQYRNKCNFFLLTYFASAFAFKEVTWNFSAAGHGKGAADGVGGAIKNVADQVVACGSDIPNSSELFKILREKDLKVKVFEIKEEEIKIIDKIITIPLEPIPNTMKLHQVTWSHKKPKKLSLRLLSCFSCMGDEVCKHFAPSPATFTFPEEKILEQKIERPSTNIAVGDWLAVIYDNLWYPGSVEEIKKEGFVLSFMHASGDKYYWPSPEEKYTVPENEIMCRISDVPQPISRRHFIIPNKKKYDNILFNVLNS